MWYVLDSLNVYSVCHKLITRGEEREIDSVRPLRSYFYPFYILLYVHLRSESSLASGTFRAVSNETGAQVREEMTSSGQVYMDYNILYLKVLSYCRYNNTSTSDQRVMSRCASMIVSKLEDASAVNEF